MSLFTDIVSGSDGVYTLTNRPDLVAETKLAVRQATLAAHRCEKFMKDEVEVFLPLVSASSFQIDIPSYFPRWRQFSYIRPFDSVAQSPAPFVLGGNEMVAPDAIIDEYGSVKTNVWYVGGTNLNIRLSGNYDSFLVGYYSNPLLSPEDSYESWVARDQPAVIVIDAARRVFEAIGYQEAAARLAILLYGPPPGNMASPTGGEYMILKSSNLEAFGR